MNFNKKFEEQGFIKIQAKDIGLSPKIFSEEILENIKRLELQGFPKIKTKNLGNYINKLYNLDLKKGSNYLSSIYSLFSSLTPVWNFASNERLIRFISRELNLKSVTIGTTPLMRLDRPNDNYFSTDWHQDYWFSQISLDSVTVWFPLSEINEKMGYMQALPYPSNYKTLKFKKKKKSNEPFVIKDKKKIDLNSIVNLECSFGEILIFKQSLLHKSGFNKSKKVRISCQLRYNKFYKEKKINVTFKTIHSPFVFKKQKKWIKEI